MYWKLALCFLPPNPSLMQLKMCVNVETGGDRGAEQKLKPFLFSAKNKTVFSKQERVSHSYTDPSVILKHVYNDWSCRVKCEILKSAHIEVLSNIWMYPDLMDPVKCYISAAFSWAQGDSSKQKKLNMNTFNVVEKVKYLKILILALHSGKQTYQVVSTLCCSGSGSFVVTFPSKGKSKIVFSSYLLITGCQWRLLRSRLYIQYLQRCGLILSSLASWATAQLLWFYFKIKVMSTTHHADYMVNSEECPTSKPITLRHCIQWWQASTHRSVPVSLTVIHQLCTWG